MPTRITMQVKTALASQTVDVVELASDVQALVENAKRSGQETITLTGVDGKGVELEASQIRDVRSAD